MHLQESQQEIGKNYHMEGGREIQESGRHRRVGHSGSRTTQSRTLGEQRQRRVGYLGSRDNAESDIWGAEQRRVGLWDAITTQNLTPGSHNNAESETRGAETTQNRTP